MPVNAALSISILENDSFRLENVLTNLTREVYLNALNANVGRTRGHDCDIPADLFELKGIKCFLEDQETRYSANTKFDRSD